MTTSPEFEHIARVTYVNTRHGLVREQFITGLAAPLLDAVVAKLDVQPQDRVGWVDFSCTSGGECGYPQTYGGNPGRLCGATYLAVSVRQDRYRFETSSDLIAQPKRLTSWAAKWLRRVQESDAPHPPSPRKRSDEIAGVLATLPLLAIVSPEVERRVDSMISSLEVVTSRRNGDRI